MAGSGPLNLEMRAILLNKQLFIRKEAHLSPRVTMQEGQQSDQGFTVEIFIK